MDKVHKSSNVDFPSQIHGARKRRCHRHWKPLERRFVEHVDILQSVTQGDNVVTSSRDHREARAAIARAFQLDNAAKHGADVDLVVVLRWVRWDDVELVVGPCLLLHEMPCRRIVHCTLSRCYSFERQEWLQHLFVARC